MKQPLTLTLPLPDHALTLNGTKNRHKRARIAKEHRQWATLAAMSAATRSVVWPYFPAEAKVRVDVRVERLPRGKKWDDGAVIEATKSYVDGFQDAGVFENDRCVQFGTVTWDLKPTGAGQVHLTLSQVEEVASDVKPR